jgi:hypothetical protein
MTKYQILKNKIKRISPKKIIRVILLTIPAADFASHYWGFGFRQIYQIIKADFKCQICEKSIFDLPDFPETGLDEYRLPWWQSCVCDDCYDSEYVRFCHKCEECYNDPYDEYDCCENCREEADKE